MSDEDLPPSPIEGIVFERSVTETIKGIVIGLCLFLVGLFLIWSKLTNRIFGAGDDTKEITWIGLLFGLFMMLIGLGYAMGMIWVMWVKQRWVIGIDRLQMLEHRNGEDVVIVQIPFTNIGKVNYLKDSNDAEYVTIIFCNFDDPDTYSNKHYFPHDTIKCFEIEFQNSGYHTCIMSGFKRSPREMATAIQKAYAKWLDQEIELDC